MMEVLDDMEANAWQGNLNPTKQACWHNEDMMGRMAKIGRKVHRNTAPQRIAERIALAARLSVEPKECRAITNH